MRTQSSCRLGSEEAETGLSRPHRTTPKHGQRHVIVNRCYSLRCIPELYWCYHDVVRPLRYPDGIGLSIAVCGCLPVRVACPDPSTH